LERAPGLKCEKIIKATEGNLNRRGDIPEMAKFNKVLEVANFIDVIGLFYTPYNN